MKSLTSWLRCSRPSAASIIVTTETIGFVIEKMRKIEPSVIGVPAARLR